MIARALENRQTGIEYSIQNDPPSHGGERYPNKIASAPVEVDALTGQAQTDHLELPQPQDPAYTSGEQGDESLELAILNHELRTPLGAILGYAEMLQEGVYGSLTEAQQIPVESIIESVSSLSHLVDDLLTQAQLKAGKLRLNIGLFEVMDLVYEVYYQLYLETMAKGLDIRVVVDSDVPPELSGDRIRLQQILFKLLDNAIKFTDAGKIEIALLRPNTDSWAIRVSDTGPGIPDQAHLHIFDPFTQADGSMTRQHGGLGLGLFISQQLTKLMGGEITLESRVGSGSTFTVWLPLSRTHSDTN